MAEGYPVRRLRSAWTWCIALLVAVQWTAGCEPADDAAAEVKIGYQALAGSWVLYVANEKLPGRDQSFLAEEGLDVEALRFDSSNTAAEALLRGDIVTDSATTMTVLFNIEERSPDALKCFGFQVHTESEFLESFISGRSSGVSSYADLAGKKLGVFPGSLNQAISSLLLKDHLEDGQVELVQMRPSLQLQALTSGQVDALISYEPTTSLAVKSGVAQVVEHSPWAKHLFEPFPVATYCFTSKFIAAEPEIAAKIARAWFRAIDYIRADPTSAAATIPIYTQIEPALARELNQPAQRKSTEVDREAVQRLADLYMSFGLISQPIDTSDIYYVPEP